MASGTCTTSTTWRHRGERGEGIRGDARGPGPVRARQPAEDRARRRGGRFKERSFRSRSPKRKGTVVFADDEYPRHGTTLECAEGPQSPPSTRTAASLRATLRGSTTAPRPSSLLIKKGKRMGLSHRAHQRPSPPPASTPKYMGMGRAASKRCLSRAGWEPKDLDLMEINEAFARRLSR